VLMDKNNVLVIGGGGREHAIAHSLSLSQKIGKIYCAPGNGGMGEVAEVVALDTNNFDAVKRFVEEKKISLTVIGPEGPLVNGLSDHLRSYGQLVMGASRAAAQLEGSKIFAKQFMAKYGIPTADFRTFDNAHDAKDFAKSAEGRHFRVLKADGLAAGKGVILAKTTEELLAAITMVMEEKRFGVAGDKILLEETLQGPEISLMALTDGKTVLPFPSSQDHKRVYDADKGPNTGGMGAYAPTSFYDDLTRIKVDKEVIQNFIRGLENEQRDFRGIIYFGLMLTRQGPKVLEFNVRLGDPETQAVLPLVKSDMYEIFLAVANGQLSQMSLQLNPGFSCTVVLASKGYPNSFETGFPIQGLDEAKKQGRVLVFHAGTKSTPEGIVTNGGRVLTVTGLGKTLDAAVVRAYQGIKKISFKNMHYRNDIAAKAMKSKMITQRIKNMKKRHARETALAGL
jgi:phosphoribosylamine--glycine ligase